MIYIFKSWTNKIPFLQSRVGRALIIISLVIVTVGSFLLNSQLAGTLGVAPL